VLEVRQTVSQLTLSELHFNVGKSTFVKNATLGKAHKAIRKMHDRIEKHLGSNKVLKEEVWEEVTVGS
jgi:pentose-5-phosphate-3-epimerase